MTGGDNQPTDIPRAPTRRPTKCSFHKPSADVAGTTATPGPACGLDRDVHPHVTLIGNGIATMTTDTMIAEALLLDVTLMMIVGTVAVHPRATVGANLFATSGARPSVRTGARPMIGAAICCLPTLLNRVSNLFWGGQGWWSSS